MLEEETLQEVAHGMYEEPEGEFLEIISSGTNTITVLTRGDTDKAAAVDAPFDPVEHTVSQLEDSLNHGGGMTDPELEALLQAEKDGKNRTTALNKIKEELQ